VPTINEALHRSVLTRYSSHGQVCSDDDKGVCGLAPYKPENLAPFFNGTDFAGLPIAD
jgi:hypothetical protein